MLDGAPASVQIYTGCGKGKSTAAVGLAARMAGCGGKVCIIQFRKARRCGEHVSAEKLGIPVIQCVVGRVGEKCEGACPIMEEARRVLREGATDLLVLDEIMAALRAGCVTLEETLALLDCAAGTELVLTGRNVPRELADRAGLITEMKKIKHFYDDGLPARRGIEY